MNKLCCALLVAATVVSLCGTASADQLDPQQIAADAKWLIHFDLDGFRQTALGKHLREKIDNRPHSQEFFDSIEEQFGLDLQQDLHAVTFYGSSLKKHQGVALMTADIDEETLVAHFEKQPDYRTEHYRDYTLHVWTAAEQHAMCCLDAQADDGNNNADEHAKTLAAVFHNGTLVMSANADRVRRALDILDGEEPSLSKQSPLLKHHREGTVFYCAAENLDEIEQRQDVLAKMALLRQTKQISVALGQHNGTAFSQVYLQADSPETAERVKKVVEGFRAMLQLQGKLHENIGKLAEGLKVSTDDQVVEIDWQTDADLPVKILREMEMDAKQQHMHDDERPEHEPQVHDADNL